MRIEEINQLFIDSIWHWMVDGIDKFEAGLSPFIYKGKSIGNKWSDDSEFKLIGKYCPMCNEFDNICTVCYLDNEGYYCFTPYVKFTHNPCIETCQAVIDELFETWRRYGYR